MAKGRLFAKTDPGRPVSGIGSWLFAAVMLAFAAVFVGVWLALIWADMRYVIWGDSEFLDWEAVRKHLVTVREVVVSKEIRAALWLSLWTTAVTVTIGMIFAIPTGYALSRYRFPGHAVVDSIVDLPILMPPLIVGLSLLVFFCKAPVGQWIEGCGLEFFCQKKGIVLCQLLVSTSFGIRALKLTFDGIDARLEHVAMTLGYGRAGAFAWVALPLAFRGIVTGAILIWTRAFGIFGPLIVFVGAVRMRTEVLPTTIYLEQSVGRIEVALAVAILMLALATIALVGIRMLGFMTR